MRQFHVIRDLPNGHKAGEFVSDLRLPRADIPGMLAAGDIKEIDAESVKYLEPAVPVQPPAAPTEPRSSAAPATLPPPKAKGG